MKREPDKSGVASDDEAVPIPRPASADEIDTAKVLIKESVTNVIFESIVLGPRERGEIVLVPDRPVRQPKLFMSNEDKEGRAVVEQVFHGRVALLTEGGREAESYRYGRQLDVTVTASEAIKVVVVNYGANRTTIGASLVVTEDPKLDTSYRLRGDEIKE